jgi:hypothetical protein
MSTRCKQRVWNRQGAYPCSRAAVRDGYCKQHHPDAKKARNEAIAKRVHDEIASIRRQTAIRCAERFVISAAKEWATDSEQGKDTADALVMAVIRLMEAEES